MLMLGIMTATLLAGTIGFALTGDDIEVDVIDETDDDGVLSPGDDNFVDEFGLDDILGGKGDDLIDADQNSDTVFGEDGDDRLVGAQSDDIIRGGDGNDVVSTGSGNDAGFGEAGDDTVQGGSGNDWLSGGDGDDFVKGDAGDDVLFGGKGFDILRGGEGRDILVGADIFRESEEERGGVELGFEDTVLYRTDDDGADAMNGDEDDDLFILGKGDYAIGGQGNDNFITGIWAKGDASFIEDYNPEAEKILVAVEAGQPLPSITIEDVNDDAVVLMDGEPLLVLLGNAGNVISDDIVFTTEVFDTRTEGAAKL